MNKKLLFVGEYIRHPTPLHPDPAAAALPLA